MPRACGQFEQLLRRAERHLGGGALGANGRCGVVGADDESAADRKIGLRGDIRARAGIGVQRDAVGMAVEHDLRMQRDVGFGEVDRGGPAEVDDARGPHLCQSLGHVVGVEQFWSLTFEAEQDGRHRAVPTSGRRE